MTPDARPATLDMRPDRRHLLRVLLRAEPTTSAPRGSALRAVLATAVVVAVALPLLHALDRHDLLTGDPVLLALLLPLPGLLSGAAAQRALGGGRIDNRPWPRLLLALGVFTWLLWAAGWPSLLPVVGVLVAVFQIRWSGSRTWPLAAGLVALFTVAGQVAARLGLVETVLDVSQSHVIAGWSLAMALLTIGNVGVSAALREASELAVARAEARLRALMDSSGDVLTVSDGAMRLTYVSPAVERAMGHDPTGLVGQELLTLVDEEQRAEVRVRLAMVVRGGLGTRVSFDVLVPHASGERRWYEWTVHNLLDDPLVEGLVVDQRDVTDRLLHSAALQHAASHDDLTGLANRAELGRRLAAVLPEAGPGAAVAVLFIDLDGFKAVNDTFGHPAGDELLVVIARRLEAGLRRQDHLARLGGDEFGAVLTEVRDAAEVRAVVDRIEQELARPVPLAGTLVRVSASIGSALTTDPREDPARLFARADGSMYDAKRSRTHVTRPIGPPQQRRRSDRGDDLP